MYEQTKTNLVCGVYYHFLSFRIFEVLQFDFVLSGHGLHTYCLTI